MAGRPKATPKKTNVEFEHFLQEKFRATWKSAAFGGQVCQICILPPKVVLWLHDQRKRHRDLGMRLPYRWLAEFLTQHRGIAVSHHAVKRHFNNGHEDRWQERARYAKAAKG